MLAEARHIEHERALEGLEARGVDVLEVRVALALIKSSGEVVLPVRPSLTLSICLPVIMEKGRAEGGVFSRRLPFSEEKSKVKGS